MSDPPETVLVTVHASQKVDPVYHLPDAEGTPRCVTEAVDTYAPTDRGDLDDRFRLCRTCDPERHVHSGGGAVCDVLSELDPEDVG